LFSFAIKKIYQKCFDLHKALASNGQQVVQAELEHLRKVRDQSKQAGPFASWPFIISAVSTALIIVDLINFVNSIFEANSFKRLPVILACSWPF
jgi:hypothetical protein